jgi:hypothetical protein
MGQTGRRNRSVRFELRCIDNSNQNDMLQSIENFSQLMRDTNNNKDRFFQT